MQIREEEAMMKAKIEETKQKARERPSMMENYDRKSGSGHSNLAKMKAMQKFIAVMNEQGSLAWPTLFSIQT